MTSMDYRDPAVLLLLTAGLLALNTYWTKNKNRNLPPGPKGWPVIGNLLDMPTTFEWIKFHRWAKEFKSDVLYCNVFGVSIVILDSVEAVNDLLDKRSAIYSSRPRMPMVGELMGFEWAFSVTPYGDAWRARRRVFQKEFDVKASRRYHPRQVVGCHYLLNRILDSPERSTEHFRHLAGALVMDIIYGIEVQPEDDPYIDIAENVLVGVAEATIPGAFLVDFLPILKSVPSWVPGAGFQIKAKKWRKLAEAMKFLPFSVMKGALEKGHAKPSFCSFALQNIEPGSDVRMQEEAICDAAGTAYGAGSDTTVSALSTFVLAMVKYPNVQAKAQAHLDRILGSNQLPSYDDEQSLPYITAIVLEVLRWQPVTPLSIAHLNTEEDNYKGYTIPAGSVVMPNAWAILHDQNVYPDPFEFKPERFIKDGQLDLSVPDPSAAFGFGRRICPGQYMARASIWIVAASMLATFDITKAVDDNGNVIEPSGEYSSGFLSHPVPFKCKITPRSKDSEQLIRMAAA